MRFKKLTKLIMILSLILPNLAIADESIFQDNYYRLQRVKTSFPVVVAQAPTCDQVLGLCKTALAKEEELARDLQAQIVNYQEETSLQQQVIKDREGQLSSPLHNPFVMAGAGAVAATLLLILVGGLHR